MNNRHRISTASKEPQPEVAPVWVKTSDAAKLIGLSASCLKNYRLKEGQLIEGVHWVYTNAGRRKILYNVELLCDWVANRASPELHLRKVEAYLMGQERRRRKG